MAGKGGLYNPRPVDDTPVNGQLAHSVTSNWAYDHAADLDAHTRNIHEIFRTGEYYGPGNTYTLGGVQSINAKMHAVPFSAPIAITADRIGVFVTTLEAGKSLRLGIYNNGTNMYPGTLLLDAGVVSGAAAAFVAATINQALTKGLYWLALLSDCTATLKVGTYFASAITSYLGLDTANYSYCQGGWSVAQAYGALPDPFTAGASIETGHQRQIALRILSLD